MLWDSAKGAYDDILLWHPLWIEAMLSHTRGSIQFPCFQFCASQLHSVINPDVCHTSLSLTTSYLWSARYSLCGWADSHTQYELYRSRCHSTATWDLYLLALYLLVTTLHRRPICMLIPNGALAQGSSLYPTYTFLTNVYWLLGMSNKSFIFTSCLP